VLLSIMIVILNISLNLATTFIFRPLAAPFAFLIIPYIAPGLEIFFMFLFLFFLTYPIQYALQEFQIGHLEIILSAPVRPKDVFFGEYFGQVVIYVFFLFIIAPIIVSIIGAFVEISIFAQLMIITFSALLLLSASFLGNCAASYLSVKFGTSTRKKDLGKIVLMIVSAVIAIPSMMISLIWIAPWVLLLPAIRMIFQFSPSTWFATLVLFFINPFLTYNGIFGFINPALNALFACGFLAAVFGLGFKYADRFFSLDAGQPEERILAKENFFYRFIRRVFGVPSSVQAKEFFRRNENLGRLGYSVAFGIIFPIIMIMIQLFTGDPDSIMIGNTMNLVFVPWIFAMMQGLMVGMFIMVRSKDMIWIYKKSPKGVRTLVSSFYKTNYFISFLITIFLTVVISIIFQYNIFLALLLFLLLNVWELVTYNIVIGVQCSRPAFEERGTRMTINVLISMLLLVGVWLGIFIPMITLFSFFLDFTIVMFLVSIVSPLFMLAISTVILFLGIKQLDKFE
ncbi:MAG: hypothetical protein ACTSRW_10385, partial [Candidatus Helarchaeota archaeon]